MLAAALVLEDQHAWGRHPRQAPDGADCGGLGAVCFRLCLHLGSGVFGSRGFS